MINSQVQILVKAVTDLPAEVCSAFARLLCGKPADIQPVFAGRTNQGERKWTCRLVESILDWLGDSWKGG